MNGIYEELYDVSNKKHSDRAWKEKLIIID